MRNLTKTLAVVSLLGSASAYPLGIGDIKLHSSLNQNLNAEISLVVSPGEDISDIKVSLAPPAKFDEAGVAWSYFLSKIKFEPIVKSNGTVVIKLSSKEALKEPFLDFLVQVSWPKGNLYREFTVLVDPPAVYKQATIPVESDQEEAVAVPEFAPEPKSAVRPRSLQPVESQIQAESEDQSPEAEPVVSERKKPTAESVVTTRKNDTLWGVADPASRQKNVSVEQMMVAIYQHNPHAFYKKNVNALMAGKRLHIPGRTAALKLSRRQALSEFNRQQKAWNNQIAPKNTDTEYAADEQVDKQLQLVAPNEAEVGENAVVTPGSEKSPSNASAEKSVAQTAEVQAIQNKVAELEKQLAVMQQLITLKDQQLAALQNQTPDTAAKLVDQEKPIPPVTEETAATAEPAKSEQPTPVTPSQPTAGQTETPVNPAGQTPAQQPSEPVQPTVPAAEVKPEQPQTVTQAEPVKPTVVKNPVAIPASDTGSDYYYATVAGLGTAALSLLGWLWWRKRKVEEETDADSMFASSSVIIVPEADDNIVQASKNKSLYDVDALGESSFLSEFTTSDFDVFDTAHGDIDPISEADVYLAYGRYQQAEELIRQAIKDQPNDDCKLKLLEIYYASENKSAFEAYAKELADAGKNFEVDFWVKVIDMGKDICPGSNLFMTGSEVADHTPTVTPAKVNISKPEPQLDSQVLDTDEPDLDEVSFEKPISPTTTKSETREEEDFDDISFDLEQEPAIEETRVVNPGIDSIEFDLTGFADTKKADIAIEEPLTEDDIETFAFDFDMEATPVITKPSTKLDLDKDQHEDYHELDQDLSDTKLAGSKDDSFDADFDFDFNFDFDTATFGSNSEGLDSGSGFEVTDLTDMDELETKLDLAKAYIDMGDLAAAKDIAAEVLAKGSADQKKSAQMLLDELE